MRTPSLWAVAAVWVAAAFPRPVAAFPKYAQAENKPCGYCHVAEKGGGARNFRGNFYKAHNLSFAGFDEATEAKKAAAAAQTTPASGNLLRPLGDPGWDLNLSESAAATKTYDAAENALRVNISAKGTEGWHIWLTDSLDGKQIQDGREYVLKFRAKASAAGTEVNVRPQILVDPYSNIGLEQKIKLTPEWQPFEFRFTASGVNPERNLVPNFQFGTQTGTLWFADITLTQDAAPPQTDPPGNRPLPPTPADPATVPDFGEATLDGMVFVRVPAGSFVRGTPDSQRDALLKAGLLTPRQALVEQPAREIRITKPFFLGKYEVTQADWRRVLGDGAKNPATFRGANRPQETISWNDAQAFVQKLNQMSKNGARYRLPTEVEWEYAARAGSTDAFAIGAGRVAITPQNLGEFAWIGANAGNQTHPVGLKKPNAWGLHDMSGNVWEWCQDTYAFGFYGAAPPADPVNRSPGAERVYRGGSWFLDARAARAAVRGGGLPDFKSPYVGLRLVRDL